VVLLADAGATLAAARPALSYRDQAPGDTLRSLISDLGVDTEVLLLPADTLPLYVADQRRTVAEHVARLAELGGGFARVLASGTVRAEAWPFLPPQSALLQGREIIDYAASAHAPEPDLAFIGASPAAAGADPRALAQGTEAVTGGADTPGPALEWRARPALRSGLGVSHAAEGVRGARAARRSRMRATCWLLPKLRPGDVIEVQGLAEGVSGGPWLLTEVRHEVHRDHGGTTRLAGVSADGPGLLGALGGLVGGLL
jgi:hypothetical protein